MEITRLGGVPGLGGVGGMALYIVLFALLHARKASHKERVQIFAGNVPISNL